MVTSARDNNPEETNMKTAITGYNFEIEAFETAEKKAFQVYKQLDGKQYLLIVDGFHHADMSIDEVFAYTQHCIYK